MAGVLQGTPLADEHLFQELEFLVGEMDVAGRGELDYPAAVDASIPFTFQNMCSWLTILVFPSPALSLFGAEEGLTYCESTGPTMGFLYWLI